MIKSHQENSKVLSSLRELCVFDEENATFEQFVGMSAAYASVTRKELADVFFNFTKGGAM